MSEREIKKMLLYNSIKKNKVSMNKFKQGNERSIH